MPVPEAYFDCDIDAPVEVEGSPMFSTDPVTGALLIKRAYAQKAALWKKLGWASPDPYIVNAYLLNESFAQRPGPVVFFDRNYAQLPPARTEPREIAFTLPGRSASQISTLTAGAIGWNPYGAVAPNTVSRLATVEYSYAVQTSLTQNPRTLFVEPAESELTFQGARVDYSGAVYVSVGNVSIPQAGDQPPIVEPRWSFVGFVQRVGSADWVVSVNITRWSGPIFQMEVVKIPNFALP